MAEEKRILGIRLQQNAEGKIQVDLIAENSVEPYLSAVTSAEALLMALDAGLHRISQRTAKTAGIFAV